MHSDFEELLSIFNAHEVKYLVVGGYAVMLYTEPRYTKDLDLWVEPGPENASRVFRALAAFGAPLMGLSPDDFAHEDFFYQIGVPPVRVDVLNVNKRAAVRRCLAQSEPLDDWWPKRLVYRPRGSGPQQASVRPAYRSPRRGVTRVREHGPRGRQRLRQRRRYAEPAGSKPRAARDTRDNLVISTSPGKQ
jgi:hypothetical protein